MVFAVSVSISSVGYRKHVRYRVPLCLTRFGILKSALRELQMTIVAMPALTLISRCARWSIEHTHQITPRLLLIRLRLKRIHLHEPIPPASHRSVIAILQTATCIARKVPSVIAIHKVFQFFLGILAERFTVRIARKRIKRFLSQDRSIGNVALGI